jgi:hypothetical protein
MEETSTQLAIGGEIVSFNSTLEIDNGATYKAQLPYLSGYGFWLSSA